MTGRARVGWAAGALSLALACGYRFTSGGELPGGARTLYVPVFRNATAEPAIDAWFTEALREELARSGREGGEASDAVVEGEVTSVQALLGTGVVLVTDAGVSPQSPFYRVQATAVVRVVKEGKTLFQTTVTGFEDYERGLVGTAERPSVSDANRRLALRRLAASLMRQAYENMTAGR